MSSHRKYRSRKRAAPRIPKGTYRGQVADGSDLGQAADVIAQEARRLAGEWSATVPGSVGVQVQGSKAIVYSDAPAAYPNEVEGVRHPVFGPTLRNPDPAWVANEHRPFLGPAADAKASDAMKRYEKKLDRMLKAAGFGK